MGMGMTLLRNTHKLLWLLWNYERCPFLVGALCFVLPPFLPFLEGVPLPIQAALAGFLPAFGACLLAGTSDEVLGVWWDASEGVIVLQRAEEKERRGAWKNIIAAAISIAVCAEVLAFCFFYGQLHSLVWLAALAGLVLGLSADTALQIDKRWGRLIGGSLLKAKPYPGLPVSISK